MFRIPSHKCFGLAQNTAETQSAMGSRIVRTNHLGDVKNHDQSTPESTSSGQELAIGVSEIGFCQLIIVWWESPSLVVFAERGSAHVLMTSKVVVQRQRFDFRLAKRSADDEQGSKSFATTRSERSLLEDKLKLHQAIQGSKFGGVGPASVRRLRLQWVESRYGCTSGRPVAKIKNGQSISMIRHDAGSYQLDSRPWGERNL